MNFSIDSPWFASIDVRLPFVIAPQDQLRMVFTAPAVHYSALATIPPRTSAPSSQPLIKWNQIIKRFFRSDDHPKPIIDDDRPLLKAKTSSPRHPHFNDETDFSIIKQNFAHADAQATVDHLETKLPNVSSSPIEPRERLPFSGPHLSPSSNNEQESTKLSAYHRHCTRQEKFIRQKQYPPLLSNANRFDPSDLPRFRDESTSNFASYRLQNSVRTHAPSQSSGWVIALRCSGVLHSSRLHFIACTSVWRTEDVVCLSPEYGIAYVSIVPYLKVLL